MRTPDEIKKGLRCCLKEDVNHDCPACPYLGDRKNYNCSDLLIADMFAYIQQLEENQVLSEELADCSLKLVDLAVDELVSFEHDRPCDEMSGGGYCETHCKYNRPQRECWIRYFFTKLGWLDKMPILESPEVST